MKKGRSRRLLLVALGLLAAVGLVVVSAAASVLAYRQFVREDKPSAELALEGLQVERSRELDGEGVIILRVEAGSPAEQAGLSHGMLIVSVNGRAVNSPEELKEAIGEYEAGDTITLTVKDGDANEDIAVTLADAGPYLGVNVAPGGGAYRFRAEEFGEMPPGFRMPSMPGRPLTPEDMPFEFDFDKFHPEGLPFDELDPEHAPHFEYFFGQSAFVMSVEEASPAAAAGLQAGDAIVEIDGLAIEASQDLIDAVGERSPGDQVTVQVKRGEETLTIEVTLGAHPDDEERAYMGVFLAPGFRHREMEMFQDQDNG